MVKSDAEWNHKILVNNDPVRITGTFSVFFALVVVHLILAYIPILLLQRDHVLPKPADPSCQLHSHPSVSLPSQDLLSLCSAALKPTGPRCGRIPLTSRRSWEQIRTTDSAYQVHKLWPEALFRVFKVIKWLCGGRKLLQASLSLT